MTYKNDDDFYKLTFSQREGEVPLPEPMRLKRIPKEFRQDVWLYLETEIYKSSNYDYDVWENKQNKRGHHY